tara:strand:- start:70 stop:1086 length:1017 start_codon:yes stop_codon:yes gene_type:complete
MLKFFLSAFFTVLIVSITTIALEDRNNNRFINFNYKLNASTEELILNYCNTFDSNTINRMYSEKNITNLETNILNFETHNFFNNTNKHVVKIKQKPFNPKIIKNLVNKKGIITKSKFNDLKLSKEKSDFIKTILPLIVFENQKILIERNKLKEIKNLLKKDKTLSKKNLKYISKMAKNYRVEFENRHKLDVVNELLKNIDVIPNSIVVAQAANESGWGSSRFAKEYNALFGEYTYDFKKGVVPLRREIGEKHLVKSFSSIDKSVQSYFRNINSHHAYKEFRTIRKVMREKNNFTNTNLLIDTLDTYAEDKNYIKTIRSIIKSNKLDSLDSFDYQSLSL